MKKYVLLLAVFTLCLGVVDAFAARVAQNVVSGRIIDENGEAVEYATVVLLSVADSVQVTGAMSDAKGRFSVTAEEGEYLMKVSYIGYEDYELAVDVDSSETLSDIALTPASNELDAVVVTARPIIREADRFVVNVASLPSAIGKDAYEVVKSSPGVWASKDGITINGSSGTRVMVNERMLQMDSDQLEAYLRSIKAEDVQKIEIIPQAGADYDADSSGGIIKITLTKQRNDGIEGSVMMRGSYGYSGNYDIQPSANLNYHYGKLSLYSNFGYSNNTSGYISDELTKYTSGDIDYGESVVESAGDWANGRLGFVYDIDNKHSIGAEGNVFANWNSSITDGTSMKHYAAPNPYDSVRNVSYYTSQDDRVHYSGTVNYIYKLDTVGSTFKVIGNYNQSVSKNTNTYDNAASNYIGAVKDSEDASLMRSYSPSDYFIASLAADFSYALSSKSTITAGAKYNFNKMYSTTSYDLGIDDGWIPIPGNSSTTDYTENVAALYTAYRTRFNSGISISAGLRGEYTFVNPNFGEGVDLGDGDGKQRYFSLFPNMNASFPLDKEQKHSIILSYSRNISRPGFWALNPFRMQISEYSYMTGNPNLNPTFSNNFSLTGVVAYKYTLSVGAQLMQDAVVQLVSPDPLDPEKLMYRFENIPTNWQYYASLNAPVTITKWWTANINLTGIYQDQKLSATAGDSKRNLGMFSYVALNFSLPADIDIEVAHWAQSSLISGNMSVGGTHNFNAGIKKRFMKSKFTASFDVWNILNTSQTVYSNSKDFNRSMHITNNQGQYLTFSLGLRYNFNAGVSFKARSVETSDDASRFAN